MPMWERYCIPQSLDEAIKCFNSSKGYAQVIGGGTDLLLDLQQGRGHQNIHTIVDVNEIPEMKKLEIRDQELFIGASVTHKVITQSPVVQQHSPALAKASGLIGGPQVRNTATIGGNVAHALPAADGTIALMAMDAVAHVASAQGIKRMPISHLFKGPGQTALEAGKEILYGFSIALSKKGQSSAFNRIMRPQGVAIAILNLAVWLEMDGQRLVDVRIAAGPSGPVPRRLNAAEAKLKGQILDDKIIDQAYATAMSEVQLRTSRHRATKEYRVDMIRVLMQKTLMEAASTLKTE